MGPLSETLMKDGQPARNRAFLPLWRVLPMGLVDQLKG